MTTEVVELVKTVSAPSFGQLPSTRCPMCYYGAVGTMFGNAPLLCGGYNIDSYMAFDTCISYHQDSGWSQSQSMVQARGNAAGVKLNSTTFWILGGYDGIRNVFLNSTEFIIQGQTKGVPGPKLPRGMSEMCAVKISENEIFVIGGFGGPWFRMKEVWIYDPQNGFARTQGPSMTSNRKSHSCSTMKDGRKTVIIVAGGYNGGQHVNSVEIYDPTDKTWHSGKNKFPITKILILIYYSKINQNAYYKIWYQLKNPI